MSEVPKDVVVPLAPRQEPETPVPSQYCPQEEYDSEREIMMKAAATLEHHRRIRDELEQQIAAGQDAFKQFQMAAQAILDARNARIDEVELALETERHRVAIYQQERDQAVADRCKAEADLRATEQLYGNLFGMLERFRLPYEIKRKSNGNGNGKSVGPDEIRAAN